jgi:hypothetical protein
VKLLLAGTLAGTLAATLAGAVAAVGLAVVPALGSGEDPKPGQCTAAEVAELRAAGDNFADVCLLPGQELAGIEGFAAALDPGQVDRSNNLRQVARLPLVGPFKGEGAYGTDLAFKGDYAFAGNYEGFTVYDIEKPWNPERVAQVVCPGSQNDISVYRDLLILSVDSSRDNPTCRNESQSASDKSSWEGIRVFDISRPWKPRFLRSVETACGSHTHTLAPSKNGRDLFVYASSYSPSEDYPDCQPPHDFISVVRVPIAHGERAKLVGEPVLFPDGGNPGAGYSSDTSGCHDITAYPAKDLAAGACMGDGILMDISDRAHPRVIHRVTDELNFSFWHSATFNNAGTKVVFTDELGGGAMPTCNPAVGLTRGADGIYDIVDRELVFRSYYKMPRTQSLTENCVAHNGSLIPVKGKDIMVQAWYQGGTSVWDFTDSANPVEIAHFDRGAISDTELVLGGSWSSYWYNGYIYSSDITRGLEVFAMDDKRVAGAKKVRMSRFNAQSQPSYNG